MTWNTGRVSEECVGCRYRLRDEERREDFVQRSSLHSAFMLRKRLAAAERFHSGPFSKAGCIGNAEGLLGTRAGGWPGDNFQLALTCR